MRCFYALVGLLLAGTIVAFLHYVSLWSALMVALVFLGMALTFFLGAFVGSGLDLRWRKQQLSARPADALAGSAWLAGRESHKLHRQPEILISRR